jgi:MoaA/NifB/PqqE/SkfB family radical SAM enzyme
MEKINFSGGEPFLYKRGKFLGELVQYCKQDLCLPSVSIVSNGSLVTEKWFDTYGKYHINYVMNLVKQASSDLIGQHSFNMILYDNHL